MVAIKPDWAPKEKGWIACVQGRIYYRSPSIEPASFVVLDASTLGVIGSIFQDGSGSIQTVNNSRYDMGPEFDQLDLEADGVGSSTGPLGGPPTSRSRNARSASPYSKAPLVHGAATLQQHQQHLTFQYRSPLITDGRYLYILSVQVVSPYVRTASYCVDIYDPITRMSHVRRVVLCYDEDSGTSSSSSIIIFIHHQSSSLSSSY